VRVAPVRIAGLLGFIVVAAAIADPAARSFAIIDRLGREDTRHEAGRWLRTNLEPGSRLLLQMPLAYTNPVLPPPADVIVMGWSLPVASALARRARGGALSYRVEYYGRTRDPERLLRDGGWIVTFDHPYLAWGGTSPRVVALARERGEPVARFVGIVADGVPLYDPVDANFLPLRGFEAIERPGPNITVWRLRSPPAGAAAPPAASSPR
jgi:hypothetical protein